MTSTPTTMRPARRGGIAILVTLMLLTVIGFIGLGTDVTRAMLRQRQLHAAASAAALAGAIAVMTGRPVDYAVEVLAVAAANGFAHGVDGVSVEAHSPPATGAHAGTAGAVEAILTQPVALPVAGLFGVGTWNVTARAVAARGIAGIYCVGALDPTASGVLDIANNASVSSPDCGVAINSNSATALILGNNARVGGPVSVVGGWSLGANAQLTGASQVSGAAPFTDPYADVTLGSLPGCTAQSGIAGNGVTRTIAPGRFCSGITVGNSARLTFSAGTYYIDSQLALGNGAAITATAGVTIILNGNFAISLGNNAAISIVAPATGSFAGLALVGLGTATGISQVFANNTTLAITGTLYFPHQTVSLSNNGMTAPGGCSQVIARKVQILNNVRMDNNCAGTGVRPMGSSPSRIVE